MWLVLVNHVGNKPLWQCHGVVSASYIVIGNDIVNETRVTAVDACCGTVLLPLGHAYRECALIALAEEHGLDVCTLTLPRIDCSLVLLCHLWNLVKLVVHVA